jgi:hypothetical protein
MVYRERASKWNSVTSYEELEKVLRANPNLFLYDTHDRENRYKLAECLAEFSMSVDGRSVAAVYHKLTRCRADGGRQFEVRVGDEKEVERSSDDRAYS